MKLIINILIIFLIPSLFAKEESSIDMTKKSFKLKHGILKENFNDSTFQHHPEYKKLIENYRAEFKNLRYTHFENDSIYKLKIKTIKMKHDSIRINLYRKLAKK